MNCLYIYGLNTKAVKAQVDTIDAQGGNAGYHPVVYVLHLTALLDEKGIDKEVYNLGEYYTVVKAQFDTIDAHGGNAGYHPVVYVLHLTALLDKKGITKEVYNGMEETEKEIIQSEAMKSTKEAYLACLFILMVDEERYGGVKTALGDNYLLGKQEYPQDLLAAKRLLADFKGAPSKAKKASEAAGEQGVAFAEGGNGGGIHPCLPRLRQAAGSARAGGGSACTSPRTTGPR